MPNSKRSYAGIPLGITVRGQIAHEYIFRVRRGNGVMGSVLGHRYQEKMVYYVNDSIRNVEAEPQRIMMRTAVDYWRNILTAEQKRVYDVRAYKHKGLTGYNLFTREALNGDFKMFVDRGDPAAVDFVYTDLTLDGAWNELDLSAIIPATARAVLIELDIESAHVDNNFVFRKDGSSNEINHTGAVTKSNNKDQHKTCIVATSNSRKVEYKGDVATWSVINICVRGWWT